MDKMAKRLEELLNLASERCLDVTFVVVVPTCKDDAITQRPSSKKHKKSKSKKSKHNKDPAEGGSNEKNAAAVSSLVHQSASTSFDRLIMNPQCISHVMLPAREHGYVEGSQHLRPTKYKESKYDTSVITLQSRRSAKVAKSSGKSTVAMEWDADSFKKDIKEAFASRHKAETQERSGDDKAMSH
jgi:phosphorylated CTD-interacting factor 1